MAYDPSQDRLASPIEAGELYAATKELATAYGTWTLGNPSHQPADDPDKCTYKHEQFFGLPGFVVGDIIEVGELPLASYPPTHSYAVTGKTALSQLHKLVPDARDVLGIGDGGIQIVHHEPFIKQLGGPRLPESVDQHQPPDCAFILARPAVDGLVGRTFRLTPKEREPGAARGLRSDRHGVYGSLYNPENGLFPDLCYGELDCLMRVVRFAGSFAVAEEQAEAARHPQEEQ